MGEIADMMLEGEICEWCGDFIGVEDAPGHPRLCVSCMLEDTEAEHYHTQAARQQHNRKKPVLIKKNKKS